VIIFYPPLEERSTLLQPLFVHELGHPTVEEHDLESKVLDRGDDEFDKERKQAIEDVAQAEGDPTSVAEAKVDEQLEIWVAEYLCDSLALHYTGPPYLFAFAAAVTSMTSTEVQDSHPPTTLRIKLMLDQLSNLGWARFLEERVPEIKSGLDHLGAASVQGQNPLEDFALSASASLADAVAEIARERLGESVFTAETFTKVESELGELLEERILPAQLQNEEPADRRAILLAGWLFRLKDDKMTAIPTALADNEFQDFLATAGEMSKVLETWRSL
jgi:hypothetical protein